MDQKVFITVLFPFIWNVKSTTIYMLPNNITWYTTIYVLLTDAKSIIPAENLKEEISPYWSFNETADISKYEDFDHKKFLGTFKNFYIVSTY